MDWYFNKPRIRDIALQLAIIGAEVREGRGAALTC